jgi:hypothetical protein
VSTAAGRRATATDVYWTNGSLDGVDDAGSFLADSELLELPIDGGTPATLASGNPGPYAVALDATNLYWVDLGTAAGAYSDGAVLSMPIAGGPVTALATGQLAPGAIAVSDSDVYWVDGCLSSSAPGSGAVMRVAKTGGAVQTIASGLDQPAAIAVDAASVYWLVRRRLERHRDETDAEVSVWDEPQ